MLTRALFRSAFFVESMRIGPYILRNNLIVAPMAGVTDRPFRQLCKRWARAWRFPRWSRRIRCCGAPRRRSAAAITTAKSSRRSVQIAGSDPAMMAEAARYNIDKRRADHRHQHGLPGEEDLQRRGRLGAAQGRAARRAHRRCGRRARSSVPVTLKIRTGWDKNNRNALSVAKIAESAGIESLAIHGRTRACMYIGQRRVRHDQGGEGRDRHSGGRQRRHHDARKGEVRARLHRRRRSDDRPRGAGPAVDLSRDPPLSANGDTPAAAAKSKRSAG